MAKHWGTTPQHKTISVSGQTPSNIKGRSPSTNKPNGSKKAPKPGGGNVTHDTNSNIPGRNPQTNMKVRHKPANDLNRPAFKNDIDR